MASVGAGVDGVEVVFESVEVEVGVGFVPVVFVVDVGVPLVAGGLEPLSPALRLRK